MPSTKPASRPPKRTWDWVRVCLMLYGLVLVGIMLFAVTRLPEHPQDKNRQAAAMLDWYCHDETKRNHNAACLAEDLYRLHTSDAYRRMPRHERLESESRLRELSVRDDYAPSMEEARRGWCVDNGMLERGVSLCRVWRDNYLRSKREL